jgi:16S rRNA (guanine966-N2)-methyltransferase
MRIISGKFRTRKLFDSKNLKTLRPTTDMAREALFNILFSAKFLREIKFSFDDCNFLDVCAGSGAVAFEALSRGAKKAVLIENNFEHFELIKKNCEILKLENEAKILRFDAAKLPQNSEFFDVVFIDPPYENSYLPIVNSLISNAWIQKDSLIVIEFKSKNKEILALEELLNKLEIRSYGSTSFGFFCLK